MSQRRPDTLVRGDQIHESESGAQIHESESGPQIHESEETRYMSQRSPDPT